MRRFRAGLAIGAMIVAAALCPGLVSYAQDDGPYFSGYVNRQTAQAYGAEIEQQNSPALGRLYYLQYCASCHGEKGEGDGPIARVLVTKPPNLRLLNRHYGMPLPLGPIARSIDGRAAQPAHGGRHMPVWGDNFFQTPLVGTDHETAVRRRLVKLVLYLNSIQIVTSQRNELH